MWIFNELMPIVSVLGNILLVGTAYIALGSWKNETIKKEKHNLAVKMLSLSEDAYDKICCIGFTRPLPTEDVSNEKEMIFLRIKEIELTFREIQKNIPLARIFFDEKESVSGNFLWPLLELRKLKSLYDIWDHLEEPGAHHFLCYDELCKEEQEKIDYLRHQAQISSKKFILGERSPIWNRKKLPEPEWNEEDGGY